MGVKITKDAEVKLHMESTGKVMPLTEDGVQTMNTVDTEDGPLPLKVFHMDGSIDELVLKSGDSPSLKLMRGK